MAGAVGALALLWVRGTGLTQPGPWEISRSAGKPGVEHAAFGFASRLEIWPRAIQMVHDTPYTGVGLNTFPWVMDRFYPGFALGPEPHAHNFLLQTAVDFGLPGLVALLWLGAAVSLTLVDAYHAAPDARIRVVTLAVGAGLLAFLLYGTMDAVTLGAKPGLALWGSLALAVALGKAAPGAHRPGTSWQKPLTVGSVVLLGAAFLLPLAWGVRPRTPGGFWPIARCWGRPIPRGQARAATRRSRPWRTRFSPTQRTRETGTCWGFFALTLVVPTTPWVRCARRS